MERSFQYPAIMLNQTKVDKPMLMFGAPAADIGFWSGIPQKRRFGNDETIGFQRDESPKRVESLRESFSPMTITRAREP